MGCIQWQEFYFQLRSDWNKLLHTVLHCGVGKVIECIKVKSVKNGVSEFKRAI